MTDPSAGFLLCSHSSIYPDCAGKGLFALLIGIVKLLVMRVVVFASLDLAWGGSGDQPSTAMWPFSQQGAIVIVCDTT